MILDDKFASQADDASPITDEIYINELESNNDSLREKIKELEVKYWAVNDKNLELEYQLQSFADKIAALIKENTEKNVEISELMRYFLGIKS